MGREAPSSGLQDLESIAPSTNHRKRTGPGHQHVFPIGRKLWQRGTVPQPRAIRPVRFRARAFYPSEWRVGSVLPQAEATENEKAQWTGSPFALKISCGRREPCPGPEAAHRPCFDACFSTLILLVSVFQSKHEWSCAADRHREVERLNGPKQIRTSKVRQEIEDFASP